MISSSSIQDLFLLKAAALFHDPPDKAWCLRRREEHKEWAEELAKVALKNTPLEGAIDMISDRRVDEADELASSVDRILLGKLIGKKKGVLWEEAIKLKNPLDPRIEINLSQVNVQKDRVMEVMKEMNEILKKIKSLESAYFALYGLYELIWIHKGLPSSPADTRIPSHSIFDHLYATVAALNWTYKGRGLLIYIDIAGVQDFIAQSRKLRDLWASSYMVSALLWSTVLDLIKSYGPDIILIPTCRFNPFFYYDLINKVHVVSDSVRKIIKDVKGMEMILHEEEFFPRFAIVPGSMTLILPLLDKNPEELIEESFRKKWKKFCNGILKLQSCSDILKLPGMRSLIRRLEEEIDYGFIDIPPFSIRISSSHIDNVSKDAIPYLKAYDEITDKNRMKKLLKVDPACMLPLTRITKEVFNGRRSIPDGGRRGFEYCTMCGKLPSIILMPIGKEYEEEIRRYLSEGEKLCPYCLMKRIFSFKSGSVLSEILEYGGGANLASHQLFDAISLAEIASFDFRESLLSNSKELNKLWGRDGRLRNLLREIMLFIKEKKVPPSRRKMNRLNELDRLDIDPELREFLTYLLLTDPENSILETRDSGRSPRDLWRQIRRILRENGIITPPINTYYALIRADGDDMGKILSGDIGALGISLEDYILNLFEGESKEIVSKVLSSDVSSAKKIARSKGIDERGIDEFNKFVNEIKSRGRIPASISYHVSISRALVIAALNDLKYVEENNGVVIYAGGDDLLSAAPVRSAVKIINKSRLAYGGSVEGSYSYGRFHKFNNYYIPSMGNAGRSYSLYIAHYRYPLYEVIKDSAFRLDGIAKSSKWVNGWSRRKDSLVITYSPRGSPESSALPLSMEKSEFTFTNLTSFLEEIIEGISSGKISVTLLYEASGGDLIETVKRMWRKIVEREADPDLFEESIKYLIRRHLLGSYMENEYLLDKIMKPIRENKSLKRCGLDGKDEGIPLFIELFRSCRLLYNGLRGD